MNVKTWYLAGAAIVGAVGGLFLAEQDVRAAGNKPAMRFQTDRVGPFKANGKNKESKLGGNYQTGLDSLAIVGGSGRVSGRGSRYHAITRGVQVAAIVPDLETRTDFPVTVSTTGCNFNEAETKGIPFVGNGTVTTKTWLGTDQLQLVVTSFTKKKPKRGRTFAFVKGSFTGTIPVLSGDSAGLAVSNCSFNVKVEVDPQ